MAFQKKLDRYRPDPAVGWEEYWIGFKGSYPDQLMTKGFFCSDIPVASPGLNDSLLTLIRKILDYEAAHGGCTQPFLKKVRKQLRDS